MELHETNHNIRYVKNGRIIQNRKDIVSNLSHVSYPRVRNFFRLDSTTILFCASTSCTSSQQI